MIFNANVLLALAILLGCIFFFFFKSNGSDDSTGGRLLEDFEVDNTALPRLDYLQEHVLTMSLTDLGTMINGRALELQDQLDTLAAKVKAHGGDSATIQEQHTVQDVFITTLTDSLMDLVERVRLNKENVDDDALDLLACTLNLAVNAIDARLVTVEADMDTLNETIVTNADGAANAAAILQTNQDLQHKVTVLESALTAVAGVAATNADFISNLKTALSETKAELELKQDLVDSVCPLGTSIHTINAAGSVACAPGRSPDGLTSYTRTLYLTRCYYFPGGYYEYHSRAAFCASGYTATGGGVFLSNAAFQIQYSIPYGETGWYIRTHSYHGHNKGYVKAYVRCTKTASLPPFLA